MLGKKFFWLLNSYFVLISLKVFMQNLHDLLDKIEQKIPHASLQNQAVSTASAGWHLHHSLIVVNAILTTLQKSKPEEYEWKFNWKRVLVLSITKKIPRGKSKVPDRVAPKEDTTQELLLQLVKSAREQISAVEKLPSNSFMAHPIFGKLNLKPALLFMELHTNHHLDIIKDMLR